MKLELKQFTINLGKDLLEIGIIIGVGILMFPLLLKAMEWMLSLWGYTL
ncbi:hypothetical protein [Romboutsia sp.]